MVMMAKVQRVKKVELWSVWKITAVATLMGGCAGVIMRCFGLLVESAFSSPAETPLLVLAVCIMCLSFLLPAAVAIRYHSRFRRWWHGFLFGAVWGGTTLPIAVLVSSVISYCGFTRVRPPPMSVMIGPALVSVVVGGGLFVLLWIASRMSRGKLQIVDGTCCPSCGYNLVGNTTYICSECGQPFTLEELDITAEDLDPIS